MVKQDKLISEKDKRIREKEDTLLFFLDNKNVLSNNITNNTTYNQTNNTLNNTNYVLNYINYSEADSMDSIRDKFKLTRDEFIKASLTNGYRGALMEKAENIIIKPYFDRESKRPMQTVDISRKKALYKDDLNNNCNLGLSQDPVSKIYGFLILITCRGKESILLFILLEDFSVVTILTAKWIFGSWK